MLNNEMTATNMAMTLPEYRVYNLCCSNLGLALILRFVMYLAVQAPTVARVYSR